MINLSFIMLVCYQQFNLKMYQQVFILLVTLYSMKLEAAVTGLIPEGRQCACTGDRLIYSCSLMGGTTTLWKGSVFDCPMDGSLITLRHSLFASNQASGICNDGDIVGRGIGVVNNCYTSQLNMTVRESFNNKTVQCILNSNEGTRIIGESLLSVVPATNIYTPPDNLFLADVQAGKLVFNWSSFLSNDCYTLQYSIASDCGTCPIVTNMTTATCFDLQLTTNSSLCQFRVRSQACDRIGNLSSPIVVTLKVPNVPQVKFVPSYSNDSQALQKVFIIMTMNQTNDLFYISDGISGSPTSYTAHAFNIASGASFNSTVGLSSCEKGSGCPIDIPSYYCSQSTIINVSVSATNKLGQGPHSNPFMIECTNKFVYVVYKETMLESTISCIFLNLSDTSKKTCCVTHRLCSQSGLKSAQNCNNDSPYNVKLELSSHLGRTYCYIVTAGNDTYTLKVDGRFTLDVNHGGSINTAAVTVAVGVVVPFVLLFLGTCILAWVFMQVYDKGTLLPPKNPLKQYLRVYNLPDTLKVHEVDRDCELREFITKALEIEFRRGHTYYEFTSKIENILEGKEVLLQDKHEQWFRLDQSKALAARRLKLYGEGIARSCFGGQYRVFIQSFGSGARHVHCDSCILYNHIDDQVKPDVLPLVPVCSKHFAHKVIEEECTVQHFCAQKNLKLRAFNIFLSMEHLPKEMRDPPPRDVILMNRESRELFTGPFARQMFDLRNGGESQNENEKWKMFALLKINQQDLILKKGSAVLYQDSMYRSGKYTVLKVDEDCVRMSKFVETRLNCKYEDGRAFYEVTENEEDLLYYKKILRPQTDTVKLGCEELILESLVEYFYAIPGVPAKAVKPDNIRLQHCKVFIQSTSQGSRCLKKGTNLLYLKELNPVHVQAGDYPDDSEVDSYARSHEHNLQLMSAL